MVPQFNIPFQTQLDYIMHELGGSEKRTADAFASGKYVTPQDYAMAWDDKYERSDGKTLGQRQQYAVEVFNAMKTPELAAGLPPNVKTSYEYFIKQGMSPAQAAGIAGNLMVEAHAQIDSNAHNPAEGAYGIAQWRGNRQKNLLDFAKTRPQPLAAPGMFNQSPQGRNAPMQQNAGGGLLANLGLQKMQPGAAGETGQKFYDRDSFKDFSGVMANWLNSQTVNPDPNMSNAIADIRNQRTEKKRRNKTVEYLRKAGMGDIADMAEAGGIGGQELMSAIIQQRMATPKTPSRIQLIEHFMSKFGMTKEQAIKASGPGGINIGGTEKEYDKRMGGSFADKEIAINEASTNATETLTTVRMMKDIAMQPNFLSGSGSDGVLQANKFFTRLFGSNTDVSDTSLANQEAFKSLSNQLILKNLGGSLGVGVSNADLAFIQTTVPTINNTKEGIKQMLNIQEKLAMRQIQISQLAMKWRSENSGKMLTSEWDMYLNTWKEANPLFVNAS